jgi:ribose transport system ATP-binding protein
MKTLFVSRRLKKMLAETFKTELQIKAPTVDVLCMNLSGGNRQKVVIAKWLARDVEIFILACPTRGVDVGAKAQIYRLMEELKHQGKGVLMISEELPELIGMSDNIMIFKEGKLVKTFKRSDQPSEEDIVMSMV